MSKEPPEPVLDESAIEALKTKFGIDETIAKKSKKTKNEIEKKYDPRLIKILQDWLK